MESLEYEVPLSVAAERIGLSISRARVLCARGRIRGSRKVDGCWRVFLESADTYEVRARTYGASRENRVRSRQFRASVLEERAKEARRRTAGERLRESLIPSLGLLEACRWEMEFNRAKERERFS